MRVFSFAAESTRYCNYSRSKFNNEVTFIIPCWANEEQVKKFNDNQGLIGEFLYDYTDNEKEISAIAYMIDNFQKCENTYLGLLERGWKPQQARVVLPNALKTELVMTDFVDDWWGEYLVIDKATGLINQRIHGKFYTELDNIDREKYRIVEKGFFPLRCSKAAHPSARELAIPLREKFKSLNL